MALLKRAIAFWYQIRFCQGGEIQAVKVIILRFRVRGASDRKASPLFRRQLDLDFVGDGACNLALQTQNIANAAIVFLSPQLALTESLRQVYRYPHPVPGAYDRTLQYGVHFQFPGDLS